jgi:cysteine desulfurase
MNARIYLDHNATTPLLPDARAAMDPWLRPEAGNASSIHREGQRARAALERARAQLAELIQVEPDTLVLTSGATESINFALQGRAYHARAGGAGDHLVATAIEHPAVLETCRLLERDGFRLTIVEVGADGVVDPEAIEAALTPETILVAVMAVNNELGTIQPVAQIGRLCRARGIPLHCDAAQAAGRLEVDPERWQVDLLSFSAHKFGGPIGLGGLYIRPGTEMRPLVFGGRHQRGRRAGTENVAAAVGAGAAAAWVAERRAELQRRIGGLRERLERGLLQAIAGAWINGAGAPRVANTINLGCPDLEGESFVIALDLDGLAASFGSACSSGAVKPSHVLRAIGLEPERAQASVRFSLGWSTTEAEIDRAAELIPRVAQRLRAALAGRIAT